MADDKRKSSRRDRSRVAGTQGYEVRYFARKHGLSIEQARDIILLVGSDREKLNAEAEKVKARTW
jgi:hypothetical protein